MRTLEKAAIETPGQVARGARRRAADAVGDPLFPTVVLRERSALDLEADPRPLFDLWADQALASPGGPLRYRWTISAKYVTAPRYMGGRDEWHAWRGAEDGEFERDRWAFLDRLVVPLVLAETTDYLANLAASSRDQEVRDQARLLLTEALPVLRTDAASYVGGRHAWGDTFALWAFARRPQGLRLIHPYALATAELYGEAAREAGGRLPGRRFPFHDVPLVSGSAQLATGLLALGLHPGLVAGLARFVAAEERPGGGWGDGAGAPDLLTTLVAADLLLRLDPTFSPRRTVGFLVDRQGADGWWRATGPETLWLTAEIAHLLEAADQPFARRFRWPELGPGERDRRTGLAFYSYLADLAALFGQVPGLAAAPVELAFLDLARFGELNNRCGMAAGDEILRCFAAELARLPDAVAIRDGGDEFLVLGAPTASGLVGRLERFRQLEWPSAFRAAFGAAVPDVAPRILVTTTRGADLVRARDELGRAIGPWKQEVDPVPATGALVEVV